MLSALTFIVLVNVLCLGVQGDTHVHHQNVDDRIVGGRKARSDEAKYTVFLKFAGRDQTDTWTCTGSLISYQYVLTARHCLFNALTGTVYLGIHNRNQFNQEQVAKVYVSYDFLVNVDADLALIQLPSNAISPPVRKLIDIVKLPRKSSVYDDYYNTNGRAYGWGRYTDFSPYITEDLLAVDLRVTGSCNNCNLNETCTDGHGGKGTCFGDSGGPLVIKENSEDLLIGVTSHGVKLCESGFPSFYVSVNKYLDWIESNSDVVVRP